jgi:peptidoglycan/xylan/chitin deacetylase (PgdA/CDA1 family)
MPRVTIPILLYHSVEPQSNVRNDRFAVGSRQFSNHLRIIADSGRTPLTISELASAVRGDRDLPERSVAVTFDDGFANVTPAVERLLDANLKATMYMPSEWVGRPRMLDAAGLQTLSRLSDGMEIGAHSASHPRLDEIRPAEAKSQIFDSKASLEDLLQLSVTSFAYPYGAYDRRVRSMVVEAGFSSAAAVKNALSHDEDDTFALARVTIVGATPAGFVEEVLAGSGMPLAWRGERIRTRGYRVVRRMRGKLQRDRP